jgi:uncharacterized membrane protein YkvA (DUF1232 family)
MSMKITFELSRSDLEHFKQVLNRAREAAQNLSGEEIIENASKVLTKVNKADTSDFIRDQMNKLETLIGMVVDEGWGLEEDDRARIINAMAYFSEADDLIPDHIPGLGFLDDAIVIEIVAQELKHEIQAYRDFVVFRAAEACRLGEDANSLSKASWLEERRKQLHSRMRNRRRRGGGRGGGTKSPFSLL